MTAAAEPRLAANRVDAQTFQRVMGSFPAGVAVVTALDEDGTPRGLTTTAVTSVSLEPPLLLVCVDLASRTLPAIRHAGGFTVNFLGDEHAPLALHFASKADDKFASLEWRAGGRGTPILDAHVAAWAECRTVEEIVAGDHVVFIGEVLDGGTAPDARPSLVYFRRSFGRWAALET